MFRSYSMQRAVGWIISPALTCWCLVFLIILTFTGTVYQVEHGLHAAQERFYNSYFLLLGGVVPFPGTQTVMAVLLVNLLGYLVKNLIYDRFKPGIVLTHLGILMMLLGGAITHHFAEESHLTLREGETASASESYGDWEIAFSRAAGEQREVWARNAADLRAGQVVDFPEIGFKVTVEEYHGNAVPLGGDVPDKPLNRMGITHLEGRPAEKEEPDNRAAGIFSIQGATGQAQRILLFGDDQTEAPLAGDFAFALRHRRYPLPITVTLLDFQREMHPGTQMARKYSSHVGIAGPGVDRELTISMNKPLRHRGFTFYQASYSETADGQQSSTLAVARNYGRLVPYIATTMVVAGMILHFLSVLVARSRRTA